MKKFDYKSAYKKYHSGDTVKITFMDDKVPVTKTVRIISIDDKTVSFEDKENVYECTSSEIVNIRGTFLLRSFILLESFVLLVISFFAMPQYFEIETFIIFALIFIGTLIIPLKSKNLKIMLWGLYPLVFILSLMFSLVFFNYNIFDVMYDFNRIIEYSKPGYILHFNIDDSCEVLKFLLLPFGIITAEFLCCYRKATICKKRLFIFVISLLIILYTCVFGTKIWLDLEYQKMCEEDPWKCMPIE